MIISIDENSAQVSYCWSMNRVNFINSKQGDQITQFFSGLPGVNFTNILWAAFAPKSFGQKITNQNCKHIKAAQKNLHRKKLPKKLKLTNDRECVNNGKKFDRREIRVSNHKGARIFWSKVTTPKISPGHQLEWRGGRCWLQRPRWTGQCSSAGLRTSSCRPIESTSNPKVAT